MENKCRYCGGIPSNGYKTCDNCLKKHKDVMKLRYKKRVEQGCCGKCGAENSPPTCNLCRAKEKTWKTNQKLQGLCTCCASPTTLKADGSFPSYCDICKAKKSLKGKKLREERKKKNLCRCGEPACLPRKTCNQCFDREMERRWTKRYNVSKQELLDLFEKQNGVCAYTGRRLTLGVNASLDHKIPKSAGGTDTIDNYQWVFRAINAMKHYLSEDDFLMLCKEIVNYRKVPDTQPANIVCLVPWAYESSRQGN